MTRVIAALGLATAIAGGPVPEPPSPADCDTWTQASLPDWFTIWLRSDPKASSHQVACYLNPFYLRGNFDGSAPLDLAVLVVEKTTGKRGVLIVHRPSMARHVVGAGTTIGNGGDDFSWLGYWRVESPPRVRSGSKDPAPRFKAEALYVVKPQAASGWIAWDGQRYVWHQGAD